ncbi:DciA family protein [Streptomyces sp. NPDC008222]|uniref:DciA family protein n=1 Tax=Streptomyces sp. NPDC008222 TaxID=3364820 RepID=UPI0036E2F28F
MTDTPQLAGADLARLALANARTAARTAPTNGPTRPKKRTVRRGTGRDPISLADAISSLGADLPIENGVAGGNVIDQWPTLCPQYDGLVQPVSYDEHTGRLDLRPSTHAYAAQLRLLGGQLARQINDKTGRATVRTIRVLPVGRIDTPTAAATDTQPVQDTPVKTRETASPGYRATLETALAHKPTPRAVDPNALEAIGRQETALRAHREPVRLFTDGSAEAEPVLDRSEQVRRAALARKRAEAAGTVAPRRVFDVA